MKKNDEKTGFWAPGGAIFADELTKDEKKRLAPLQTEYTNANDPERKAALKQAIAEIKAEFKSKRKSALYSLFAKV